MKWILLVLLALNLSFAGYQYWLEQRPEGVSEPEIGAKYNNLALTSSQLSRMASSLEKKPEKKVVEPTQCVRIKGLAEADSIPVLESRLKALEIKIEKVTVNNIIRTDYQLLLGPFASQEVARVKVDEIAALGIESYVITSGKRQNSLSMGVFSNQDNADRRKLELNAVGIDAVIYRNEHFTQATELVIPKESAVLVSNETIESMLSSFEGATFYRYNCK